MPLHPFTHALQQSAYLIVTSVSLTSLMAHASLSAFAVSRQAWSLGVILVEMATGEYPFKGPFKNRFAELTLIVRGYFCFEMTCQSNAEGIFGLHSKATILSLKKEAQFPLRMFGSLILVRQCLSDDQNGRVPFM